MIGLTSGDEHRRAPRLEDALYSPSGASGKEVALWYGKVKGSLDCLLALFMLVLTLPLILVAALAVKITSRGPILYSQIRLGRGGKPFRIYKLRTMTHDCEKHSGARWSTPGDARITPLGRFLRKTHIDELPQLWNVLRADMSLVGPRPERPEFIPQLEQAMGRYRERLAVRPGVTGLAQVQLPPDTDLESVRRKLAHDLGYVERMSFWLDLRILISTGLHVLGLPYSVSARLLALPGGKTVERAYAASVANVASNAAAPSDPEIVVQPSKQPSLVADLQPA